MSYVFVPAYHQYGLRAGPVKAFVVHMAEGGGTVGFLSRPNANGVSVHYVIEYSGRIVQMLHERQASGSINPRDIRTTEGPDPYGARVRREVMQEWDSNPNAAVISLEIEGFARTGPNADQQRALVRLVDDVRGRFPRMGLLGHRDFQDYKACPGGHIDWVSLGGHGLPGQEEPMKPFPVGYDPKLADIRVGAQLHNLDTGTDGAPTVSNAQNVPTFYAYRTGEVNYRLVEVPTGGVRHLWLAKLSDCTLEPIPDQPADPAIVLAPGTYRVE